MRCSALLLPLPGLLVVGLGCVTARTPAPPPPPPLDGHALCGAVFAADEGRAALDPARFADGAGPALRACLDGDAAACAAAEAAQPGLALTAVGRARLGEEGALDEALARDAACAPARALAAERAAAPAERLEHLRALEAVDPSCARCDREIGLTALALGQRGAARAALARALEKAPEELALLEAYAPLAAEHEVAAGVAAYEALLAKLPEARDRDRHLAHRALARLHEAAGQPAKALASVEAALAIEPADVEAARTRARLSPPEKRAAALEALLALDEEDLAALTELAKLADPAQPERALDLYDRALAAAPEGEREALEKARRALLDRLQVPEAPVQGWARTVINSIRRSLGRVYEGKKAGKLDVRIVTDPKGEVTRWEIVEDTLEHAEVRAALKGHLARAKIRGGAKTYAFTLEFKP